MKNNNYTTKKELTDMLDDKEGYLQSSLSNWIAEFENEAKKIRNFYRCYTDKSHGFYFDVYPNKMKAINCDGLELIDYNNQLSNFISDLKHGEQ
jgi:hypothetical protein